MKRVSLLSATALMTIGLIGAYDVKSSNAEAKIENIPMIMNVVDDQDLMLTEHAPIIDIKINAPEPKRPTIPNLAIDDKLLEYIWSKCEESDFAYTAFLAIAQKESKMGTEKKPNHNRDGTVDYGIMQVNSSNVKWLAELAGLKKIDPKNDYQSVDMAIELLKYERDFWRSKGMSEEDVFKATIITYHLGRPIAINYIHSHGLNHPYLKEVKMYKEQFEKSMEVQ